MIDHNYKCIFIHIPRTGGTSVVQSLTGCKWENLPNQEQIGGKHMNVNDARELYAEWWDDYFKFTFIRNPFDWLVSVWTVVECGNMPFHIYVRDVVEKGYVTKHKIDCHFSHQVKGLDFVGRFENLLEDYNHIANKVGCPMSLFDNRNRSPRRPEYWIYYGKPLRKLVAEKWGEDLRRFGYAF